MAHKTSPPEHPFVDNSPGGTISKCSSVLRYIAIADDGSTGEDIQYGRFLVLMAVCNALKHAEAELEKPALAVVGGAA